LLDRPRTFVRKLRPAMLAEVNVDAPCVLQRSDQRRGVSSAYGAQRSCRIVWHGSAPAGVAKRISRHGALSTTNAEDGTRGAWYDAFCTRCAVCRTSIP